MSQGLSAEQLLEAKLKRTIYAEIVAEYERKLADIDSVLESSKPIGTSDLQRLAEGLPWRSNQYGEGTFATNYDGSDKAELKPLFEAISRASGKLVLGHYEYSRNGRFLNRRAA